MRELITLALGKAGNTYHLSKLIGLSAPSFYNYMNHKRNMKMISVVKLKKLLNYLGIDFNYINGKVKNIRKMNVVSIENPNFPINLNTSHGAYLLGLIVSDGCIYIDRKARGVVRTKYAAGEEESAKIFEETITAIYGRVHIPRESLRNCIILRIGSSIVGDSLLKVGAILGHKASIDGPIPWLIKNGSKEMKTSYLRAVFDDESCVYQEKIRKNGFITISRYRHLHNLSSEQLKELEKIEPFMSSRSFPTGHITKTIPLKTVRKVIKDSNLALEINKPTKLLLDESSLLSELGIENRIFGRYFTKTDKGKYSLCFDLFINKKASLTKFYKEIGYSLPRKQLKLRQLIRGDHGTTTLQHFNEEERSIQTD